MKGLPCPGDSGVPAFAKTSNGQFILLGKYNYFTKDFIMILLRCGI